MLSAEPEGAREVRRSCGAALASPSTRTLAARDPQRPPFPLWSRSGGFRRPSFPVGSAWSSEGASRRRDSARRGRQRVARSPSASLRRWRLADPCPAARGQRTGSGRRPQPSPNAQGGRGNLAPEARLGQAAPTPTPQRGSGLPRWVVSAGGIVFPRGNVRSACA